MTEPTKQPTICPICKHPNTAEGARASAGRGNWCAMPAVRHEDGRVGHLRCFLIEGTVSLGGRTGQALVDDLDKGLREYRSHLN